MYYKFQLEFQCLSQHTITKKKKRIKRFKNISQSLKLSLKVAYIFLEFIFEIAIIYLNTFRNAGIFCQTHPAVLKATFYSS